MPGIARQFEPQITRSGGAPSRYRFTTRCSACHKADTYESSKSVGDELVKGYFKERGWLLGRDRAYDLCPTCLAKPREAQPPRLFQEAGRHRSPEAANHSERLTAPLRTSSRATPLISWRATWASPKHSRQRCFAPSPCRPLTYPLRMHPSRPCQPLPYLLKPSRP